MRNNIIIGLLILLSMGTIGSQELIVRAVTKPIGGGHMPYNTLALWIQTPNHDYVRSLKVFGREPSYMLKYWRIFTGLNDTGYFDTSVFDGVTAATRKNHDDTIQFRWDCKDSAGNVIEPGVYQFWIEFTDGDYWWGMSDPNEPYPGTVTKGELQLDVLNDSTSKTVNAEDNPYFVFAKATFFPNKLLIHVPNGNEIWYCDSFYTIEWTPGDVSDSMRLEYTFDNGGNWITIDSSVPNSGNYLWQVPSVNSKQCKMRIIADSPYVQMDISDSCFSIIPTKLSIIKPNGFENLYYHYPYTVTWNAIATIDSVKLEYTADNGIQWKPIVAVTKNSGSYEWKVVNENSSQCRVRISDALSTTVLDTSDSTFSIVHPVLKITSPTQDTMLCISEKLSIKWQSEKFVTKVNLSLTVDNGITWNEIIKDFTNGGSYLWEVPSINSAQCRIQITDAAVPEAADTSDTFTITTSPLIKVIMAIGGFI